MASETGPDTWQSQVLQDIKDALIQGFNAGEAIKIAIASGHGAGKTALLVWVILWFMSTRAHPQIVVTANTASQLSNKTWRELAKWHKLALNTHWFEWTATKFAFKAEPETWFAAATPWNEKNSEAFAGTHAEHVLLIFDEASAIADVIWDVCEGATTGQNAVWLAFGNPTRNTGRFSDCFNKFRHRWITRRVDSRTCKKANKTILNQWIEDWGLDSDFVRIRVLGLHPQASSNQFIPQYAVSRCMNEYKAIGWQSFPLIIGVDPARMGDDMTVITRRQGRKVWKQEKHRHLETTQIADKIIQIIQAEKPEAIVIDACPLGVGIIDQLKRFGYSKQIHGVNGANSPNEAKYHNKRAEIWGELRQFIMDGAELPLDPELEKDLVSIEFGYSRRSGKQLMEEKADMKARGLASPDCADSLGLTLAVSPAQKKADKKEQTYYHDMRSQSWMVG